MTLGGRFKRRIAEDQNLVSWFADVASRMSETLHASTPTSECPIACTHHNADVSLFDWQVKDVFSHKLHVLLGCPQQCSFFVRGQCRRVNRVSVESRQQTKIVSQIIVFVSDGRNTRASSGDDRRTGNWSIHFNLFLSIMHARLISRSQGTVSKCS